MRTEPGTLRLGLAESGLSPACVGMSWAIFRTGSDNFRAEYGDITESTRFRIEPGTLFRTQSNKIPESIRDIFRFTTEPFAPDLIRSEANFLSAHNIGLSPQRCRPTPELWGAVRIRSATQIPRCSNPGFGPAHFGLCTPFEPCPTAVRNPPAYPAM